jgi:hypothetical protein
VKVSRRIYYPESALIEYGRGTPHYTRDSPTGIDPRGPSHAG